MSDISLVISRLLPITAALSSNDMLHIANYSVYKLADHYKTPLYIFDRATIMDACKQYQQAFNTYYYASKVRIFYASKAYISPLIARIMAEQGLGLDVVSGGELVVAQRATFPMEHISFHGNNKSEAELRLALKLGVGRIVLDNWNEVERVSRLAQGLKLQPSVLLRVAPEVETDTHRYLQTGHASSKFGFSLADAKLASIYILHETQLHLVGLHAHTGTMLRKTQPYQECLECLLALADEIHSETGWWPQEISPGGGWAIDTIDTLNDAPPPDVEILAQSLQESMERGLALTGKALPAPTLIIEPGRSIIARAGIAVYRVGARKSTAGGVTYLFIDGGMADNIRPALYGALYTALPVEGVTRPTEETVCISGRYCESGDMLIDKVQLPRLREGDYILVPTVGAYCLPMASNYNLVPRPAVILIDGTHILTMERRETYDDVLARYGEG
ncbi:MAG: diaminopimelate decarboxylase [Ktedonobacteraceae bacterium]